MPNPTAPDDARCPRTRGAIRFVGSVSYRISATHKEITQLAEKMIRLSQMGRGSGQTIVSKAMPPSLRRERPLQERVAAGLHGEIYRQLLRPDDQEVSQGYTRFVDQGFDQTVHILTTNQGQGTDGRLLAAPECSIDYRRPVGDTITAVEAKTQHICQKCAARTANPEVGLVQAAVLDDSGDLIARGKTIEIGPDSGQSVEKALQTSYTKGLEALVSLLAEEANMPIAEAEDLVTENSSAFTPGE